MPKEKTPARRLKRLKRDLEIVLHCTNWREILSARRSKLPFPPFRLRSGLIVAGAGQSPLGVVDLVLRKKVYTRPGFAIGPEDVVIDIGANIGMFTLMAASKTRGTVIAVEPSPPQFAALEANIAANGFTHVRAIQAAVSDREGAITLNVRRSPQGSTVFDAQTEKTVDSVEVPTVTLQGLLAEHGLERVDYLKMDCEGAEGLILPSTPPECLKRIRRIVFEFHDHLSPLRHEALQQVVENAGFRTRLEWKPGDRDGLIYALGGDAH
jgi:FkbM family methyltransferase